uniref:Uncharacterized protein n=1 Tax=Anguilla anguilla TaxID=7936 RepID=A0A0E9V589_ANGAN
MIWRRKEETGESSAPAPSSGAFGSACRSQLG